MSTSGTEGTETEETIPKIKTKSKVKPLQERVSSLQYEKEELLEEMYENGTRQRPTIMSQIEEKEAECVRHIKFCISECKKETGRDLIPKTKDFDEAWINLFNFLSFKK